MGLAVCIAIVSATTWAGRPGVDEFLRQRMSAQTGTVNLENAMTCLGPGWSSSPEQMLSQIQGKGSDMAGGVIDKMLGGFTSSAVNIRLTPSMVVIWRELLFPLDTAEHKCY